MVEPKMLSTEQIKYIHEVEHRTLTLEECDGILEYRRRYGDLQPQLIAEEIQLLKEKVIKGDEMIKIDNQMIKEKQDIIRKINSIDIKTEVKEHKRLLCELDNINQKINRKIKHLIFLEGKKVKQ